MLVAGLLLVVFGCESKKDRATAQIFLNDQRAIPDSLWVPIRNPDTSYRVGVDWPQATYRTICRSDMLAPLGRK